MKITYMAFLGILIALMVSCAENSSCTFDSLKVNEEAMELTLAVRSPRSILDLIQFCPLQS